MHIICLLCLKHHRYLPQRVHEGISNGFRIRSRRTNNCIVPVPGQQTHTRAVSGTPATSLPLDSPPHLQLREGDCGQARPGTRAQHLHWGNSGPSPRCRSRWWRWITTVAPTLAPFSDSASSQGEIIAGYDGTSCFPYWEARSSASAGTWGSTALASARGRDHTLTFWQR